RCRLLIGAAIFCSLMPSASAAERHDGLDDTFFPSGFPPIVLSQSISIPDLVTPANDLPNEITPNEITLERAFQIAEQSNRDIEQAAIAVRQSEAAVREQQAGYQPSVSVSAGGDYSLPISGDNEDSAGLDGGIGLSYTLLDFGRREAAVNISSAELQVTELELKVVRQTVRLDIATLYYELQNAIENVRINQAAVANSERNLRDTELREQAGVGTRYDSLQAQTQLADDQVNLLSAQNDQVVAERGLAQILGIGETIQNLAVEPIAREPNWPLSLEETVAQAYETRAELSQQRLEQTIQQDTAKLAQAELSPELSLSTGYSFSSSLIDTADTINSWQDGLNISLDVEWTLYDGGVAQAQANQANASEAIAVSEFANQQDQIRLEVETAYLSLQSETKQISAAEVGIVSAEEGLNLAQLRFQAGVGTQLEVLTAQSDLTNAQSTLAQATTAYNQSIVELQRAISGL
ncbi:MAG: TolC family protein, partial [Cyanobacteria bacterium J06555_13]